MDSDRTLDEIHSAVSWAAIFAGATTALAVSLVLITLGAGFGLTLGSPWPGGRAQAVADFTPVVGALSIVVQVIAAGLGGYLAGRLRTKWLNVHTHEVFFRDTAHGLVAWAVAVVGGALLAALAATGADGSMAPMTGREMDLAGQAAFFLAFGLMLSAFTASVAAALGGLRRDEMHARRGGA